MSLERWNTKKIKQFKRETGQALLHDEQTLVFFSQDFGKLVQSTPEAVFIPSDTKALESFLLFSREHKLPLSIRGNGLSQSGQSLSTPGGVTLSLGELNKTLALEEDALWMEANASWRCLLERSLQDAKAPFVLPYNCNLSIGGVLSAGGIGASSFKYGSINAHVKALEVIDGRGMSLVIDEKSPLFHACLSGQGRCAVITKACIKLRSVQKNVKTFCLVYADQEQWFADIERLKEQVDYMELFCSPSIQGAQLKGNERRPMAQWLYGLHCSIEYEQQPPQLSDIKGIKPWNVLNIQEEGISSYFMRHNSRFELMSLLGQWDLYHPWYECFIGSALLKTLLNELLDNIPLHYANLIHIVPVAKNTASFLMLPEEDSVCELMILNPGISPVFKDSSLQIIHYLDKYLLPQGAKRYLSGFLGEQLPETYWQNHFGEHYRAWMDLKKTYDPAGVFNSMLFSG